MITKGDRLINLGENWSQKVIGVRKFHVVLSVNCKLVFVPIFNIKRNDLGFWEVIT